jgi:hypothetical protein
MGSHPKNRLSPTKGEKKALSGGSVISQEGRRDKKMARGMGRGNFEDKSRSDGWCQLDN